MGEYSAVYPIVEPRDVVVIGQYMELKVGTPEYEMIASSFKELDIHIVGIHKVLNSKRIDKFLANEHSNTARLFHCPNPEFINDIIIEGLDQRLSKPGMFGHGIYFTPHILKADQYSKASIGGVSHMLVCTVNLGNVKEYAYKQKDQTLKREPAGFDSIHGNITCFDEFVVYDNTRVVIDYIISYVVSEELRLNAMFTTMYLQNLYLGIDTSCMIPDLETFKYFLYSDPSFVDMQKHVYR
jgi:hypothetical protein